MKKIAVIDSGSGGINILKQLFSTCSGCKFLFYADEKEAPYGNKSPEFLMARAEQLVSDISSFFKPDIIVFACNTLTSVAIENCRKKFPATTFIGCEPALKPACEKYDQKDVLLLATPVTIKNSKILKRYPFVQTHVIENLPKLIDENLFDLNCLQPYLQSKLMAFHPKAVVLGCTHFEAIRPQLEFLNAEFFASANGVAKRLKTFAFDKGENELSFMTSGNGESLAKFFKFFML